MTHPTARRGQVINDFETNALRLDLERPIELAWAVQPAPVSFLDSLRGAKPEAVVYTPVPAEAAAAAGDEPRPLREEAPGEPAARGAGEAPRAGFLGVLMREYRGGGVSARYERIVLGREPEVPRRSESQRRYDAKYARGGGGLGLSGSGTYVPPWQARRRDDGGSAAGE